MTLTDHPNEMHQRKVSWDSRQRAAVLLLGAALVFVSPRATASLLDLMRPLLADLAILHNMPQETRNLKAYGDRHQLGYGYLRQIVDPVPENDFFPVTRYQNYTQDVHLFFPGNRNKIDSRMVVGIDIPEEDLTDKIITPARKIREGQNESVSTSFWGFVTADDYDSLTGFRLNFESASAPLQNIRISLLYSPRDSRMLQNWTWENIDVSQPINLLLEDSFRNFSFSRGSLPFVVVVETIAAYEKSRGISVTRLEIIGIKVDLSDYAVVHRDASCFTAFRKDFLAKITTDESETAWRQYLESVRNA